MGLFDIFRRKKPVTEMKKDTPFSLVDNSKDVAPPAEATAQTETNEKVKFSLVDHSKDTVPPKEGKPTGGEMGGSRRR